MRVLVACQTYVLQLIKVGCFGAITLPSFVYVLESSYLNFVVYKIMWTNDVSDEFTQDNKRWQHLGTSIRQKSLNCQVVSLRSLMEILWYFSVVSSVEPSKLCSKHSTSFLIGPANLNRLNKIGGINYLTQIRCSNIFYQHLHKAISKAALQVHLPDKPH